MSLVPDVHLIICLDSRIAPGPVLHALDMARAQEWQQETVLVCDETWKKFVNIDQPVVYVDREKIFSDNVADNSIPYLESFLSQLDSFEVHRVTQIGELSWGRWLDVYFESDATLPIEILSWPESEVSSLQVINELAQELSLDITAPLREQSKSSAVYIDPYDNEELSPKFLELVKGLKGTEVPNWLSVVCREQDFNLLASHGLEDALVEFKEFEMSLFNQPVLCFSKRSIFSQTSRSYNIAVFEDEDISSLFMPGDISVAPKTEIHISELFNILAYWRSKRLKELSFQWMNMGIEIKCVENFHSRVVLRDLLNYSTDLFHSQIIVDNFVKNESSLSNYKIAEMISMMRKKVNNDPYALSFSLKILLMIVERMMASAQCGERLFVRLGSDYHRVVIGEALIEGLIEGSWSEKQGLDIKEKLQSFHKYLVKIDFMNDQMEVSQRQKESV